jgi:hypothetical protein
MSDPSPIRSVTLTLNQWERIISAIETAHDDCIKELDECGHGEEKRWIDGQVYKVPFSQNE